LHETFSPPLKPRKVLASYRVGDLAYWALSHDLAIFDADDHQTMPGSGIVIIGRIDSGLDAIADAGGSFQLTIKALTDHPPF
jgi:hypothetical protein